MGKNSLEEVNLIINTSFLIDEEMEITFKNINIETLNKINKTKLIQNLMIDIKWYMFGMYDKITIDDIEYVIISKTKKKIELVRMNTKTSSIE